MPGDPSRPSKPTWRDPVKASDRRQEVQRAWRKDPKPAPGVAARRSRLPRLAVAFLLLAAGVGGVVALIYWINPPKPAYLVLVGDGYETNLAVPHNAHGVFGLRQLARAAANGGHKKAGWWDWRSTASLQLDSDKEVSELADPSEWSKLCDTVRKKASKEKTLVFYLSLHGHADEAGPYLILEDMVHNKAETLTGRKRLYIKDLIAELGVLASSFKGKDQKNLVVILDATQAVSNPHLGMLHNDFARQVKAMGPQIDTVPNLLVVVPSSPEQRAWVSEEWRQTVFGYYFTKGLSGDATQGGPRRLGVDTLLHYVSDKVRAWAAQNRDAQQDVMVLGAAANAKGWDLVVNDDGGAPADVDEGPTTPNWEEIERQWDTYHRLETGALPPYSHSPHRWRRYGEMVLRYEQLLRMGDPTGKAGLLAGNLKVLADSFAPREADLASATFALPLARALGQASLPGTAAPFGNLYKAKDEKERRTAWEDLVGKGTYPLKPLQAQFGRFLLDKAATEPLTPETVATFRSLLALAYSKEARPAELHFLSMFQHLRPENRPSPELLHMALAVRRQAEEAALAAPRVAEEFPYSEMVFPAVLADVRKGDEKRQLGEDRLFSTAKADQEDAEKLFKEARDNYADAAKTADRVRRAIKARDRALAYLPYYGAWLVHQSKPTFAPDQERLWDEALELNRQLDPDRNSDRLNELPLRSAHVEEGLEKLAGAYTRGCTEAEAVNGLTQDYWRRLDDLLGVPLLPNVKNPTLTRRTLLEKQREVAHRLANDPQSANKVGNLAPARSQAQAEGLGAAAALGHHADWITPPATWSYDKTVEDCRKELEPTAWQDPLVNAGQRIAACRARLAAEVKERAALAARSTEPGKDILEADRWSRLLDGAESDLLDAVNPSAEHHRLRLRTLLVAMAQRAFDDHWWGEAEGGKPYYKTAAETYLADARDHLRSPAVGGDVPEEAELAAAEKLRKALGRGELRLTGPKRVNWTTEDVIPLTYKLEAADGNALGVPVCRFDSAAGQVTLLNASQGGRLPIKEFKEGKRPAAVDIKFDVQHAEGAKQEKVTCAVFYRGLALEAPTTLDIYPYPTSTYEEKPVPPRGDIAVRVHESGYKGSLVIVLDCTGSMGPPEEDLKTYDYKTPCKYHRATQALNEILPMVPKGTHVTFLVFGHEYNAATGITPVVSLFKDQRWNPKDDTQRAMIIKRLEDLVPGHIDGHYSPVVEALLEARRCFEEEKDAGYKAVVLLTDGEDNSRRFWVKQNDSAEVRQAKIKAANDAIVNAYQGSGIMPNVFLVEPAASELKTAKAQFGVIENLKPIAGQLIVQGEKTDGKGRFDWEGTKQRLILALRPKYRLQRFDGDLAVIPSQRIKNSEYHLTTFVGEFGDLQWVRGLPSERRYTSTWPYIGDFERSFYIRGGEHLLVTIKRPEEKFVFERTPFFEYRTEGKSPPAALKRQGPWALAVLQNESKQPLGAGNRFLQLLATVEDIEQREAKNGGPVRQINPGFVWFEVSGRKEPYFLACSTCSDYPAPAWSFDVQDPRDYKGAAKVTDSPRPALKAWVVRSDDYEPLTHAYRLPREVGPDKLREMLPISLTAQGLPGASIEALEFVQPKPGASPEEGTLVVRLRYEGEPLLARLEGEEVTRTYGARHEFFQQAKKYTGRFTGISREQFERREFGLRLLSVAEIKAKVGSPMEAPLPPSDTPRPPPAPNN